VGELSDMVRDGKFLAPNASLRRQNDAEGDAGLRSTMHCFLTFDGSSDCDDLESVDAVGDENGSI